MRSGSYPLTKPTTAFEAINLAGGFRDNLAIQTDVKIIRGDVTFHFNYRDYIRGKSREQNIRLRDGDEIQVDERPR